MDDETNFIFLLLPETSSRGGVGKTYTVLSPKWNEKKVAKKVNKMDGYMSYSIAALPTSIYCYRSFGVESRTRRWQHP